MSTGPSQQIIGWGLSNTGTTGKGMGRRPVESPALIAALIVLGSEVDVGQAVLQQLFP